MWSALVAEVSRRIGATTPAEWDTYPEPDVTAAWVEARLALLADLTRSASFDAVARLCAARTRVHLFAIHLILRGGDPDPTWPEDLREAVSTAATEADALTALALAVLGGEADGG